MDYHAFQDYAVKPGSLGKAMIGGVKVAIIDEEGKELPAGTVGQVAQWRDSKWIKVGDSAYVDEEGYFWYVSRIDDVIISAGYTIGPIEVEGAVMKHPAVAECAVVGSPDKKKGEIVKAFITLKEECKPTQELATEIQQFVKTNLSKHEYPAAIEFVEALPKTPDGKLKRKDLKERERQKKSF
jgi:acetyl-CoA synthetase